MYLERRVVGSFITITSVISPNLLKYSLSDSEKNKQYLSITNVVFNLYKLFLVFIFHIQHDYLRLFTIKILITTCLVYTVIYFLF